MRVQCRQASLAVGNLKCMANISASHAYEMKRTRLVGGLWDFVWPGSRYVFGASGDGAGMAGSTGCVSKTPVVVVVSGSCGTVW
jgi:hypothetical protein